MVSRYRLADGTPAFHALGELPYDAEDGKVSCGLCGSWLKALPTHLRMAHSWTADDYRAAFGLNAQRPLQAPDVSARQAKALKRRIKTDARIRTGMRKGLALARAGELNRLGRVADRDRGRSLERRERTRQQGHDLGRARAERLRRARDDRARDAGYPDAATMIERCYLRGGVNVSRLAELLGCAETTVIAEMDRLGIDRRPQDARLALGRRALAERRVATREQYETQARSLGFPHLAAYLKARHHDHRWPRKLIAAELGVTVPVVARLLRECDVPALRGLSSRRASVTH